MSDRTISNDDLRKKYHRKFSPRKFFENFRFSMDFMRTPIFFIMLTLVLFGTVMIISTISYNKIKSGEGIGHSVFRQCVFIGIGIALMFIASAFDYRKIGFNKLIIAGVLLIIFNLLPGFIGDERLGATRWIVVFGINIQPSEPVKYYIVFLTSYLFSAKSKGKRDLPRRFLISFVVMAIFVYIIGFLQSNLSTCIIIIAAYLTCIFLSGVNILYSLIPLGIGGIGSFYMVVSSPYRLQRILGMTGKGEGTSQITQSLYALATGGIFGRGLGYSRLKANWLPIAENDFIFAIICEELGFLGALLLIVVFFLYIREGYRIAASSDTKYGMLLASGITTVIALQALVNMIVVTGLGPVTGLPLPFISSGGTSLVVNIAMTGFLTGISRERR